MRKDAINMLEGILTTQVQFIIMLTEIVPKLLRISKMVIMRLFNLLLFNCTNGKFGNEHRDKIRICINNLILNGYQIT